MMRLTRRDFYRTTAVGLTGAGVACWGSVVGQATGVRSTDDFITSDTESAINRGLGYLAAAQAPNGSFSGDRNGVPNAGITALAALALLSGGHHPGKGKYGHVVGKAAEYIISCGLSNTPRGFLCSNPVQDGHSAMYQHGFAALFLAELHGTLPAMAQRTAVRDMLERGIALTIKAQNAKGGWRYSPEPRDDDVSVTVAHLMALRAAKNAGVFIDKSVVDKAIDYIKGCRMGDGGYAYVKGPGGSSLFPRSAAAVVGLFCAGIYDGEYIERGLRYLMQYLPVPNRNAMNDMRPEHFYYGHYYAALAMWTAGGNYWSEWFPAIRNTLLLRREQNNLWIDHFGTVYATAMACIILQLPNNYLPIMQK